MALGAFIAVTRSVIGGAIHNAYKGAYLVQTEQAVRAFQTGGAAATHALLSELNQAFDSEHFLIDERGKDLITGADRSAMLTAVQATGNGRPAMMEDRFVFGERSKDGHVWLLVVGTPPFSGWSFAPFYLVTLAAVVFISWLVAIGIAAPLRVLASAADRFGRGDFAARVRVRGTSEIGTVAASFNEMADRIQTLMTAERRLLQDISHELRSPLARMKFAAELARTAPDRQAAIDRLQRDLDRLTTLVGELLEITRAEGDPATRRLEPVDLNVLVGDVVEACQLDADTRACRIVVDGRATRTLRGDAELLRRAIENVLRNAIAHAPDKSEVTVRIVEEAKRLTLAIRDLGPGVPDGLLTRIFAPFYRVDPSRETQTGGIGLGLSITARAVQLHHGTVQAENARPGLRVVLSLPHG
jgi:two-component system sensor histidine kinase CpxA